VRYFPPDSFTVTPMSAYERGPLYPWYSPAIPALLPTEMAEGTVVPRAPWPTGPGAAMEHPPIFGPAVPDAEVRIPGGEVYIGPAPLGNLLDGYGAGDDAASFHFVTRQGKGGYVYRLYADGRILWLRGQQQGMLAPDPNPNSRYQAVLREVGPYTPEAQVASATNVVSQVIAAFSNQGREAGLETARSSAQTHGPAVLSAASEYLSARADNAEVVARKLARLRAKRSVTKDPRTRSRMTYRIRALEQRMRTLQGNEYSLAVADDPTVPGDSTRVPRWVPLLGVGVAVVSLALALDSRKKTR